MRPGITSTIRFASTVTLLCATLSASVTKPVTHKKSTTTRSTAKHTTSHSKSSKRGKAAKKSKPISHAAPMSTERATQIQTALIKQGYLSGEPTGTWDEQSIAAVRKLQSDNGWQTKIVPDSRALIKLGLGPQTPPEN
jgi:hypothetical protein